MKARLVLPVVSLLLGASLVGCGGNDKPAVCGSVDTLKGSLGDLKNISLTSSGALSSLQTQLTTVKTDFDAVKTDAKSQFGTQVTAVDTSYATLKTSADAATSAPSAAQHRHSRCGRVRVRLERADPRHGRPGHLLVTSATEHHADGDGQGILDRRLEPAPRRAVTDVAEPDPDRRGAPPAPPR